MDTVTVTLNSPVVHEGKTTSTLTFREPTVEDMIAVDRFNGLQQTVALMARLSDQDLPTYHKIKARDLKRIMAETSALMGNEPESTTGD